MGFGATSGQHHLQLLPEQSLSLGFCCYINFSGGSNPAKSLLRLLGNETQHCLDLPALLGGRLGIAPKPRCSCPSPGKDPELWVPGSGPELSPGMLQRAELGLSSLQARAKALIHPHRQVNSQLSCCCRCWRSLFRCWAAQSAPSRVSLRFSCPQPCCERGSAVVSTPKSPCPTFPTHAPLLQPPAGVRALGRLHKGCGSHLIERSIKAI